MAGTRILTGSKIKVYINGNIYGECQSLQFTLDSGDHEIYGIDSFFPQEIAPTRSAVSGQIQGLRISGVGGLQGKLIKDKLINTLSGPYVSIRVVDRHSLEEIIFIPQARIPSEQHSVVAKQIYRVSFAFRGITALQPLDRTEGR
jgi:hypothetical protein